MKALFLVRKSCCSPHLLHMTFLNIKAFSKSIVFCQSLSDPGSLGASIAKKKSCIFIPHHACFSHSYFWSFFCALSFSRCDKCWSFRPYALSVYSKGRPIFLYFWQRFPPSVLIHRCFKIITWFNIMFADDLLISFLQSTFILIICY